MNLTDALGLMWGKERNDWVKRRLIEDSIRRKIAMGLIVVGGIVTTPITVPEIVAVAAIGAVSMGIANAIKKHPPRLPILGARERQDRQERKQEAKERPKPVSPDKNAPPDPEDLGIPAPGDMYPGANTEAPSADEPGGPLGN